MKPTRQIVREIQQLLTMEGSIQEQDIQNLAAAYVEACQQVSDRAARCLEFLRRGMRDKAVEVANAQPDLRSEIEALQFPEIEEWVLTCEMIAAPATSNLDADAVWGILKEVYSQNPAYDQLLGSYRRMALGRAPLGQRIRVLRQICRVDPKQEFWKEDQKSFETAYVQELLTAAELANRQKDYETLKGILAELQSPEWLKPRPQKAAYVVEQMILPHRKRYAGDRFFELGGYLHQAHSSLNEEACRHLVTEWQAVTTETGVEPTPEQAESIAPVLAWLNDLEVARQEEANFQRACASLETALDDNKARPVLEMLAAAVLRLERGMPELLAARYNSRIQELMRHGKRRFALRLAAVICTVLLLAAGTTALVLWRNHEQAQVRWQEQISAALEKNDLEGAGKLFVALEAENRRILSAPEIQNLRVLYDRKNEVEQKRQNLFKTAMAAVERAGVEVPDTEALAEANLRVKTSDEKALLESWREKIQRRADEARLAREAEYEKSLQELENSYVQSREADPAKSAELADKCLAAARRLLGTGGGSLGQLSRTTAVEQALLKARVARIDTADRQKQIAEALVKIQGLVEKPEELVPSMSAFIDSYPEHPLASDFAKALHSASHWKGVVAWHDMLRGWGGMVRESNAVLLKSRAEQINDYLKAYPDGPCTASAQACRSYLEAGAKSWSAKGLKYCTTVKHDSPTAAEIGDRAIEQVRLEGLLVGSADRRECRFLVPISIVAERKSERLEDGFADVRVCQCIAGYCRQRLVDTRAELDDLHEVVEVTSL